MTILKYYWRHIYSIKKRQYKWYKSFITESCDYGDRLPDCNCAILSACT